MPRIIMNRGFIARWTRMPHSTGRLSASASSHHSLSSAAFITNIAESDFRHAQDAGGHDQLFLGDLGAEIAIVAPVGSDDGQRDMVAHAGCGLRREKVAAGGLEEFQHGLVFK